MRYVPVTFGDKEKNLLFTFSSISLFDKTYGKSFLWVLQNEEELGNYALQCLYYVGLKHGKDAGMTYEMAGQLINKKMSEEGLSLADFEKLFNPIKEALELAGLISFEEVEEGEGKN